MSRLYVYQKIEKLVRRHGTRDPFELLDAMHVQVRFYFDLHSTKGFSRYFLRQYFVGINGNLPGEEQRIVAAHELGHIVLHAQALKSSPVPFSWHDAGTHEFQAPQHVQEGAWNPPLRRMRQPFSRAAVNVLFL